MRSSNSVNFATKPAAAENKYAGIIAGQPRTSQPGAPPKSSLKKKSSFTNHQKSKSVLPEKKVSQEQFADLSVETTLRQLQYRPGVPKTNTKPNKRGTAKK